MTIWTPDLASHDGPRYLAIAGALEHDIRLGHLAPGDRLPTHRDLAYRLGVTVGTVSRAYAEAVRRDLVAGEVGRGTYVRGEDQQAQPGPASHKAFCSITEDHDPNVIDFGLNLPAWDIEAPYLARTMREIADDPLLGALARHQPAAGRSAHRAAGAKWLARTGLEVSLDQIFISSGAQHGMMASLIPISRPGDLILTESLTFPGIKALAAQLNLRLEGLEIDHEGILPDAFDRACRTQSPKALYCVPTHHNPTTATMSEERRRDIATVARQHGVFIIEDDVYGFLPEHRPPPLAAFAPELTFFITSTSKSMSGGLRTGYIVPPASMAENVDSAIKGSIWFTSPLSAEITSRWILDGTADQLIAWQRKELLARHALVGKYLPETLVASQPSSYHFWLTLPAPWRGEEFVNELQRQGVIAISSETFTIGRGHPPHAIRVCLCGVPERDRAERGLEIIANTLRRSPGSGVSVI